MSELTTPEPKRDFLSQPVLAVMSIDWEKAIYIAFIILAIVTRFFDLGSRVMSHDESLHTQFSYQFYDGQGFSHTPLMHGPLLFHITAVSYWMFGDNDFASRVPIALLSVMLVAIPYFLRRWLGREGAIVTSFIFLISPYLTYYGRYIRHDIPVIMWALIIFIAIMFYLREQKDKYLWWFAAGMALMFATKEVSFIYTAIFGSFLVIRLLTRIGLPDWIRPTLPKLRTPMFVVALGLLMIGGGFVGHTLAPNGDTAATEAEDGTEPFAADPTEETAVSEEIISPLDQTLRWVMVIGVGVLSAGLFMTANAARSKLDRYPEFDFIVLFTSIVLPMASPLLVAMLGWDPRDYTLNTCMVEGQETMSAFQLFIGRATNSVCVSSFLESGMVRTGLFLLITLLVGVLLGLWWNWQRYAVIAAIFHTIFFILYTSVFTNLPGWTSGMIGSLGYWLEQQAVQRGNQPEFYYFVVVPLYEFLSLIFALAAIRLWTKKQRLNSVLGYWLSLIVLSLLGYSLGNWFFNRLNEFGAVPNTFYGLLIAGLTLGIGILVWFFLIRSRMLDAQNETALIDYLSPYLDDAGLELLCNQLDVDPAELEGVTTEERIGDLVLFYSEDGRFSKLTTTLRSNWSKLMAASTFGDNVPRKFNFSQQRTVLPSLDMNEMVDFIPFIVWWLILTWVAYTVAGEKMPWLSTHFVIPMAMLSGWYFQEKIKEAGGIRPLFVKSNLIYLTITVVGIVAAAMALGPLLLGQVQFGDQTQQNLAQIGRFFGGLLTVGVLFYFREQLRASISRASSSTLTALGVFVVLSLLTIRFTYMANFQNADYATEYMVYAHGAPAAKSVVMNQVEELSMRLNGDKTMKVAFGGSGVAWPFTWYLRDYPNRNYFAENASSNLTEFPIVIVGRSQMENVDRLLKNTHEYTTHTYLWWPMEEYRQITWNAILGDPQALPEQRRGLGDAAVRQALWDIFFYRDYSSYSQVFGSQLTTGEWPLRDDLRLYIRRDVLATLWDYGVGAINAPTIVDPYAEGELFLTPSLVINELGVPGANEGELAGPRNVAVTEDGRIFVADSGNARIQVFEANGELITAWGSFGTEPGQFNEPWDLAVDDQFVYVADTWNHRVQKFTHDGELVGVFGSSGSQADAPETEGLGFFFGPRDVMLYGDDQLLVTDTGNHRIQVLDRNGNFITQIGSQGGSLGQMFEPVGLTGGQNGDVFLVDTWNSRVQQFTGDLFAYNEWQVNAWAGNSINNKPYIASDRDGRLYVTDPEGYRILIFNVQGEYLGRFGTFGTDVDSFGLPNGIFIDSEDYIYIADSANNRLLKFDPIFPAPPETAVEGEPVEQEAMESDEAVEDEAVEEEVSEEKMEDITSDEETADEEESEVRPTPTEE
ncbi:MAG: TIGR03663 family protein [Chloroflexi bacterium]|nr:MAG: TIGR03663 family protein [Chloroflexota bacterium]